MSELLFTPASVLDLLSQIDELQHVDVGIDEISDNEIQVTVGESTYIISSENATVVEVDEHSLDMVEDANMEAYEVLEESGEIETVEGGVIKEIAKTLLVGGLVRLTTKLLK